MAFVAKAFHTNVCLDFCMNDIMIVAMVMDTLLDVL